MIRAGKMRHRVSLQTFDGVQDDFGEPIDESWNMSDPFYVAIKPIMGSERFNAQQVKPDVSHEVRARFRVINARDRFIHGSTALDIEHVIDMPEQDKRILFDSRVLEVDSVIDPTERGAELILLCKEIA